MKNETIEKQIAKLEAKYQASTGREVYKIGAKLRALKLQLNHTK
jgi:hypothetical protein